MSKSIYVLNGPNLNLLGVREPEIYGYTRLDDIKASCEALTTAAGYTLIFLQSNHEGQLIDWIHEARTDAAALIINPAGYGHTSVALLDALKTLTVPIIECHLSNPGLREAFRHHTYVSHVAKGVIAGFGPTSYELAVSAVLRLLKH